MIGSFRHTAEQRDVHRIGLCVLGVAVAIVVLVNSTTSSASTRRATARAAHVLGGTATARLHLVYPEGSELIEEGPVTGALTGSARATLHTGAVFKASFTIRTSAGSISGHGEAQPGGSGRYQSFKGSFLASGGSGRYAHIRGRAGLYGVFDRRYDSVVIQTTGGELTY
jgi:hypothetical protein